MKNRFYLLMAFASAMILSACSSAPINKKTVVVDPGHGGKFAGVRFDIIKKAGYKEISAIREQDLTLVLAKEIQKLLAKDKRFKVIMTRESDIELDTTLAADLKKRTWIAQENKADALISIHVNSIGTDWTKTCDKRGFEVFFRTTKYYDDSDYYVGNRENIHNASKDELKKIREEDRKLQKKARDGGSEMGWCIASKLKQKSRIPPHNEGLSEDKRNLYILRSARIPTVILEAGYLCNDADRPLLEDKKEMRTMAQAIYEGIVEYGEKSGWFK